MSKNPSKFFPAVYAALFAIAIAISVFVASLMVNRPVDLGDGVTSDGELSVNPTGAEFPSGPPSVPPPDSPPPLN